MKREIEIKNDKLNAFFIRNLCSAAVKFFVLSFLAQYFIHSLLDARMQVPH